MTTGIYPRLVTITQGRAEFDDGSTLPLPAGTKAAPETNGWRVENDRACFHLTPGETKLSVAKRIGYLASG